MSFRSRCLGSILLLALLVPSARAATKLEGDYQLMMDLRKWDRPFVWDYDANSYDVFNNIQFRLFSQPMPGVESFVKVEAAFNPSDNNNASPSSSGARAPALPARVRKARRRRVCVLETGPLLHRLASRALVYGRGDAQGIRVDTWGWNKTNVTFIASDRSGEFNPANFPDVPHQPAIPSPASGRCARRTRGSCGCGGASSARTRSAPE